MKTNNQIKLFEEFINSYDNDIDKNEAIDFIEELKTKDKITNKFVELVLFHIFEKRKGVEYCEKCGCFFIKGQESEKCPHNLIENIKETEQKGKREETKDKRIILLSLIANANTYLLKASKELIKLSEKIKELNK